MSKPVRKAEIVTMEELRASINALFDSGSFHTLIRESCLPPQAMILRTKTPEILGTAEPGGSVKVIGRIVLKVLVEGHEIEVESRICPALSAEFIIGARDMQGWDISIRNENGHTTVHIGHDLNDPDIQTVL